MMKLSLIEPNEEQPRKDFNEELIGELADSIKKYGVLQPLLVQKKASIMRSLPVNGAGVQQKWLV